MNKLTTLLIYGGLLAAGVSLAGGSKCTVLATAKKANRWAKRNQNRTPDKFVILGFYEPAWLDAFCEDAAVETVALDFKALVGQELKILQEQGFSTMFPDENIVLAFRRNPSPQIYFVGGDGPDEAVARRAAVDQFMNGEIDGQPVTEPGARIGGTSETAKKIKDLFGVLRGG